MIKQLFEQNGFSGVYANFPLKNVTSFKIGGEARFYALPETIDELFNFIKFSEDNFINYKIIGNGTNLLFSDDGFDGLVVSTRKIKDLQIFKDKGFLVSAGTPLGMLTKRALEAGLSGLEFAVGIPGTVGGAIVMNAGADGGDMSSVVKSVTVLEHGGIKVLEKEDLDFKYRSSYFLSHPKAVILFAEIELIGHESREVIASKMNQNLERRKVNQPKEPSAGCVFKKLDDKSAGQLIDEAGLKGYKFGGAEVSRVHANFIVNTGSASSKDVLELIKIVKDRVYKKFNKTLELELEIVDR